MHDDEHDGCDDGCNGGEEGGEEGEDRDQQADPARVDCDQLHGHHDEGKDGASEEEGEHPVGDGVDEVENVVYVGWEGDCEARSVSGCCGVYV